MNSVIMLKSGYTTDKRPNGDVIKIPVWVAKYAEKKSVRQSEHYQAAQNDLKPEILFEMWEHEYSGQKDLKYDNQVYHVIRTYAPPNSDKIELVCGRDVI